MWQAIAEQINNELDEHFEIEHKSQLAGGNINIAYHISGKGQQYFVKINQREQLEQFETEVLSLQALHHAHCIKVPGVICAGQTLDKAYLVLEYLPLSSETVSGWRQLGQQLAVLHRQHEQAMYGFDWDNMLGNTPQPNKWQANWSSFFSEQRIGWLLQLLLEQGFGFGNIDVLVEQCRQRLQHYQPEPSLLHGDLWRGNVGFIGETPAVFDPACYYGDREADLAYTTLFGRFPENFYQAYQELYPLDKTYTERRDLYNLYHVLNHAYLFRGAYLVQAQEMIKQLFH